MHSRLTLPLALALVALSAGCAADRGGTLVDGPQVVMRIERDGPLVNDDVTLAERLSGGLVVEDRTARAAYCVNGWDWVDDVTLDTIVMVSTLPRLLRAAELVGEGEFDADMAVAVEADLLASDTDGEPSVSELSMTIRDGWGDPDLRPTWRRQLLLPRRRRHVASSCMPRSWSTYGQFLTFVDLERADRAAIERFAEMPDLGDDEILIAGDQASVSMNSRDCDELDIP